MSGGYIIVVVVFAFLAGGLWSYFQFGTHKEDKANLPLPKAEPKYTLIGIDGNAFGIMYYVCESMKECGLSPERIDEYNRKAMSGDYRNLLRVSQEMCDELNELVTKL